MKQTKVVYENASDEMPKHRLKPAKSPKGREDQLVGMSYNLAEKRIMEGTASAQEITHFLRLGSPNAKLEREILELKKQKLQAEIDAIQSERESKERYGDAIKAFTSYRYDINYEEHERPQEGNW